MKFLFLLLFALPAWSQVYVAFIEVRDANGKVLQLENDGRYAHMAISYKGQWLHSYPNRGVELISNNDLEKIGKVTVIPLKSQPELNSSEVAKFLGKPFDFEFSWDDNKIYCAELVAKLLHLAPAPMQFSASFWPKSYQKFNGQLGISPDDIFQQLQSGRIKGVSCVNHFAM